MYMLCTTNTYYQMLEISKQKYHEYNYHKTNNN